MYIRYVFIGFYTYLRHDEETEKKRDILAFTRIYTQSLKVDTCYTCIKKKHLN